MQRDSGLDKRENEEQDWSSNDQQKQGGRASYERMQVLKTMMAMSADAMQMMTWWMQTNK